MLVNNPWLTARTTAAALVRKVDDQCPTLLLDESDAAFKGDKDYAEALRGILNSGHRQGGKTTACVGQGANIDYKDFSTFSPKAIAGIGDLPDTIGDRSIRIIMMRRAPDEPVERFRYRIVKVDTAPIRAGFKAWGLVATPELVDATPQIPDELDDRSADGWEPLLAIADLAGGEWPAKARDAAKALSRGQDGEDHSLRVRLLLDIQSVFGDTEKMSSSDLLEGLNAKEESPWSEWNGKPLTPRGLAKMLKPFGVKPTSVRIGDSTPKGYEINAFKDVWRRYTPNLSATSATFSLETVELNLDCA